MKKAFVATAVSGLLLTASILPVSAHNGSFRDIPENHTFYKEIYKLHEKGIIKGHKDGYFNAYQKVTRAQAATMIARALELDLTNIVKPNFTDIVETNEHYQAIAKLTELGIFKNDTSFNPNGFLTRAQMAKILVLAFELKSNTEKPFDDVNTKEFKKYTGIIGALNITTNNGRYNPNKYVTRGQLAAFLERVINNKRLVKDNDPWDRWNDWEELERRYQPKSR